MALFLFLSDFNNQWCVLQYAKVKIMYLLLKLIVINVLNI